MPEEEAVTEFFGWLATKHVGWELPALYIRVKMLAGCRTLDLCSARTADLGVDSLTLSAEATKTREARTVPLPVDILCDLRRLAGATWLWERSLEDSKVYRPSPKTKSKTEYTPSTWRWTLQNIFREFNRGRPNVEPLRPHDLRARAITIVAAATQSIDATAQALGIDPQTARHYLDAGKAFDRTEIMRKAAELLQPKEQK